MHGATLKNIILILLKYIHTIKATCFSYKEPLMMASNTIDPYLVFGVWLGFQLYTLLGYCCIQYY